MKNALIILLACLLIPACGNSNSGEENSSAQTAAAAPVNDPAANHAETVPPATDPSPDPVTESKAPRLMASWFGDLDGMIERSVVRVLTVYGPPRYFLDGTEEKGATYEAFRAFEKQLNEQIGSGHLKVHVIIIPIARDRLIPALLEGRGDIAAAGLTITPERQAEIDFSNPLTKPISEILVTGPSAPPVASIEDLAGQTVLVRPSSSYRASLEALNARFEKEGKTPVDLQDVSPWLEDDDLLEMVSAGLLPWAVVDDYKARSWATVFENLDVREDIVFREGGRIAYAIRKDSPKLLAALNGFVKTHRQGTLLGNIMINRYVRDFDWAQNALANDDFERFSDVDDIFRKYGEQYGIDYLLATAQGYQESRLDQSRRSAAGAVGIMQLLPSTAADPNVGIPDISDKENNIHAGVKYLDFIRNRYFSDAAIEEPNNTLFALASYNAGPARVRKLRTMAEEQGYDPNVWFDNVEVMAAKDIGRETVQYVSNIVKYYLAYRASMAGQLKRGEVREEAGLEADH
ncbi:MAG: transporter substrate-binding domain-containing protein [Xanthomonadales bacterium]|jgi:membrane-bound lytic murein transglycosylase MltF|nr:transporter substrate-binding domain-containing protein [Xanthomonadales bacterium]